jgi:peptide/nickel transport system permease protein
MTQYLIRRLMFGVILIFLASVVSFTILRASPGEPGATELDPRLSREYVEQQKRLFGLDQPPVKQYFNWMGELLRGDLGMSIQYKQPVTRIISSRLVATLVLNLITLVFTWTVAIPLGTYAAVHQYKWPDKLVTLLSFVGMSFPGFFLAFVLLWIFAGKLQWLPPGGLRDLDHDKMGFVQAIADYARHLLIPVVVLTFGALAGLQRITRGNMLETLRLQYITTARAKGLSQNKVIYKHALRNAINPLITLLGFEFAALFGGAALLEIVLNFPGMGQLLLEALRAKDQALVMSLFLIGSVLLVLGNLFAEILLAWVDPRVSYA